MLRNPLISQYFLPEQFQTFCKELCVIGLLVRVEIKMQIHPAVILDHDSFIRPLLFVIPGYGLGKYKQFVITVVMFRIIPVSADFPDIVPGITQCSIGSHNEPVMVLIKGIDVIGTVITAVHDKFDL